MAKTPTIERKSQNVIIQIDKGATFRSDLIWKIGDPAVAKDLTGYTGRMQIRPDVDSDSILHEMTTENGGITITPETGTISLYISDTDTTAFTFENAYYDLEIIDANGSGDVRRLVYGDVEAFNEATR